MTHRISSVWRRIVDSWAVALLALVMALNPLRIAAAPYADFVIDARTGEVLHATNSDTRLHPASLTKMMTLYIAFEAIEHGEISLDTMVTVSKHAASMPPSKLGLRAGQKIALRYLIRAAAIKSANDAATAIGEAIEGTEAAFAKRMTRTAKAMGMDKTTFKNANGLTAEGHLSTAHDMTILGRRLFYDYPQYYNIFSRRTADAGIAQVSSTNRRFLDSYEGADGIKTGYTVPAGFNLTASAQRGNERIIATVLGGKSTAARNARMVELLDLGFAKAPKRAKVQPPPLLAYSGDQSDPDEDLMAEVIAANVDPTVPAAGKTLRLNVAVAESPYPKTRPTAAAVAMAAADATGAAIGSAAATVSDVAIAAEAVEMAEATDKLMAGLTDDITAALAEAQDEATEEAAVEAAVDLAADEATDEAVVVASAAPTDGDGPLPSLATALAPQETPRPAVRPAEIAALAVAKLGDVAAEAVALVAEADAQADGTDAAVAEVGVAEIEVAEVAVEAVPAPDGDEVMIVAAAPDAAEDTTPLGAPDAALTEVILPAARPETVREPADVSQIVLASAEVADEGSSAENLEIVTRVSTSGGREYGINVGSYGSRYNAERELLRTALVEMSTLDEALRKVVSRNGAFDANFVGMTQEDAELACRRLTARGTECSVLTPSG